MFGSTGNYKEELIALIEENLREREAGACDTWDPAAVVALPWGVKVDVDPAKAGEVEDFMTRNVDEDIEISEDRVIQVLKAGLKQKNDQNILIFRYQLQ